MNLNKLINMVTNHVIRRVVTLVVDRGINFASRKVADIATPDTEQPVPKTLATPDEIAKEAQLRLMADQAAKTAATMRPIGR